MHVHHCVQLPIVPSSLPHLSLWMPNWVQPWLIILQWSQLSNPYIYNALSCIDSVKVLSDLGFVMGVLDNLVFLLPLLLSCYSMNFDFANTCPGDDSSRAWTRGDFASPWMGMTLLVLTPNVVPKLHLFLVNNNLTPPPPNVFTLPITATDCRIICPLSLSLPHLSLTLPNMDIVLIASPAIINTFVLVAPM